MVLKNIKKSMVASGVLGQIPEKKFGHPSSGYPTAEELASTLTNIKAGVDMAGKNPNYPTEWELVKEHIYRRYISKSQPHFKYRLRVQDGTGRWRDKERMYDDKRQPFTTIRAAEAHMNAHKAKLQALTPESLKVPDLHTIDEIWADYMENRGSTLRTSSLAKHDSNVRNHISPRFKKKHIENITLGEVNNFITKLREKKSYETVRGVLATMCKIWKYAKELHIISRDTFVEIFVDSDSRAEVPNKPKKEEKEIKTFEMEDIDKCFEYAKTEGTAYYILLCLTFYAGVRMSEALGLTWEDVHFDTGKINIRQQLCYDRTGLRHKNRLYIGPPKEHDREFDAAPQLLNALKEWKVEQEQNKKKHGRTYHNKEVLDNEITGGTVKGANFVLRREDGRIIPTYEAGHFRTRLQNKVFEDAHFHGMRRTLVTKLIDGGVPLAVVSQYIGHADTRTTELYYLNKKKLDSAKVLEVVGKI